MDPRHDASQEPPGRTPSKSRRSASARRSSVIVRTGPTKHSSNASLRSPEPPSASDEQSLTSFPSLSPSLENSPEQGHGAAVIISKDGEIDVEEARDGSTTPSRQVPASLQHLFSPAPDQSDRRNLFLDVPQDVNAIPGVLHLQNDKSIKHLIERTGPVKLVKRLALDLARRDAHVTMIQRKAEERERLLRKMLRECEVSDLDIESRLRDLDQSRAPQAVSKAAVSGTPADASMDSRLSEAVEDQIDSIPGVSIQQDEGETTIRGPKSAVPNASGTTRGWKTFFRADNRTVRSSSQAASNASRRSSVMSQTVGKPTSMNDADSGIGLGLSRASSRAASLQDTPTMQRGRASSNAAASEHSSTSLASWALRMVAGGPSGTVKPRIAPSVASEDLDGRRTARAHRPSNTSLYRPTAGLKRTPSELSHKVMAGMVPVHSPQPSLDGSANLGPVEMDTILPEDTRPPTLGQHLATAEFLTDNFGFIYDQRRKRRLNEGASALPRNRHGDQVEPLQNPRAGTEQDTDDESRLSLSPTVTRTESHDPSRPDTPLSFEDKGKKWHDYLKFTNIRSELLSHTPSTATTTEITVGEVADAKVSLSTRASIPAFSRAPVPSPTRVVSGNAEFVSPSASMPVTPDEDDKEPETDPVKALVEHLAEVHEAAQREKTVRWNEFLRKVRAERRRSANVRENDTRRRSVMPETFLADGELIGVAGLGVKGKVGRAKGNEFRALVLAGIPTAYRSKIWAECSGATSLRVPGYYEELTQSAFTDDTIVQQIQMDITRTLTDNIYYRKGAGVDKLKEVLLAYARRNPSVGYCQGMNLITANLLLILPTAEDAFWVLTSMIENILPDDYYSPTLLTSRADQVVLRRYVSELLPQLSRHLDLLGIELEALTFQWFLSVFTDCLSAEALFRVWDVILCLSEHGTTPNGQIVTGSATFLFQVALALLKLNEKALMACDNPAEIYRYINRGMTNHAISIDNLIRASEGLRREVRPEEVIARRRKAVEDELETMKRRETIRRGKGKADEVVVEAVVLATTTNGSTRDPSTDRSSHAQSELVRRSSRSSLDEEDEALKYTELTLRTPMPIDEEAFWRA